MPAPKCSVIGVVGQSLHFLLWLSAPEVGVQTEVPGRGLGYI